MFRSIARVSQRLAANTITKSNITAASSFNMNLTYSSTRSFAKKADKKDDFKSKNKAGKGNNIVADEDAEEGTTFEAEEFRTKMNEIVEDFEDELSELVIGRPTPESLESIQVDYEGQKTSLSNIAQVYPKPPVSLVVALYEPSPALEASTIEAIANAGMDLNPVIETVHGMQAIVVPFPRPTKELRDSMTKISKAKGEEYKTRVRASRKDWNDGIKKAGLPTDDAKRAEKVCQDQTDTCVNKITQLVTAKEKEFHSA